MCVISRKLIDINELIFGTYFALCTDKYQMCLRREHIVN